ncbi:MAG TPA: phenylalanine--tRNA ligase subunit beta [Exilispira sp.]|nr:phenylalanine--tRNA ligase subunit beta [Exilispira sp.]
MYISLNWLKEYVDFEIDNPVQFAELFTRKVAEIEELIFEKDLYDKIITAKVIKITKHPNADKLLVLECLASDKNYTIVTGATNLYEGAIVPLALSGAKIPVNDKVISDTDFRGVVSHGMLCSPYELKLETDHTGIMILDPSTPVGVPLAEVLNLNDIIFLIDNKSLTHRPDLWGHYGIAREVSAILKKPLKPYIIKEFNIPEEEQIKVDIESYEDTPMYGLLYIKNITRKESPTWLKQKLFKVNQRPISFLVDLTNYIMFDIGEPSHAFDANKLKKLEIKVRRANQNEQVVTLDGIKRECSEENLLICDYKNTPVGIAGVMGLQNSEIDDDTEAILLELANFDPATIRKSAILAGIRTEASNRYEKSLDPAFIDLAMQKFCYLLTSLDPNAQIVGKKVSFKNPPKKNHISLSTDFINKSLGVQIKDEDIVSILKHLQFDVFCEKGILNITVPTFRSTKDIKIKEDIVEEVGRIYGYDNIIPNSPSVTLNIAEQFDIPTYKRIVKDFLAKNEHFTEVLNYPFSTIKDNQIFGYDEPFVTIKNPLDNSFPILTKTLLPRLLLNTKSNLRFFEQFKIFECEHVFWQEKEGIVEEPIEIAAVIALNDSDLAVYEARDALLHLINSFNIDIESLEISTVEIPSYLHPYKSGRIIYNNQILGIFGQLHPDVLKKYEIEKRVSIFTTYLDNLLKQKGETKKFEKISKFPIVSFDLAFVLPEREYINPILKNIKKINPLIHTIKIFDIYKGENLGNGKKSLAINISLLSRERTLTSDDMHSVMEQITTFMESKGFELRK